MGGDRHRRSIPVTAVFAPSDLERLRGVVARRIGLRLDDANLGLLGGVLQRGVEATGEPTAAYLDRLESQNPLRDELRTLAQGLTVAETFFFRNIGQFRAFTDLALPDRSAARSAVRKLSLLSAGCASGDEAYSLAILVRERFSDPSWDVSILGVDVNPLVLEKAVNARYSSWSLRETPTDIQRRWFREEGRDFVLDQAIRTSVKFEERNLADDDPDLWQLGAYDVVFCRNVIMYFTPEAAQALIARITKALAPGGYLFLGHAETLRGLSHDYQLCHTHGTLYYQRNDAPKRTRTAVTPASAPWRLATGPPTPNRSWTATSSGTVQRAAERIQALTEKSPRLEESTTPIKAVPRRPDLSFAFELLKSERFSEAFELLRELPREAARDPDVLLLRAVLLTHGGQLDAAEKVCAELLERDELNTGAHYLLALCREGIGDRQGAVDHDQVAVYLDSAFAMPRLHLGLLARRRGDRQTAQRELEQALMLLQREDTSRLLLFGGGFSREALMTLCGAELVASGSRP
jgi:chemotaxis protein methyltransferase CheR